MRVTLTQRLTSSLSLVCETTTQDASEAQEVLEQLAKQLRESEEVNRLFQIEKLRWLEELQRTPNGLVDFLASSGTLRKEAEEAREGVTE
jgi:hypothetical protein